MTVCIDCGAPSSSTRCPDCQSEREGRTAARRGSRHERGYDRQWERLSARARRLQPFCTDCGTQEDLTADHLPHAWQKREQGHALTTADIEIVCRSCNSRRGATRGANPRTPSVGPASQPEFASHTAGVR